MEDQQALPPDDKTHGAEDGGPAGANSRRQDTAPKMEDLQALTPDDKTHGADDGGQQTLRA